VNRDEYRRVARDRLRDSQVLLRAKCYVAAYYVAGYAIEAALKACIAKQFRASNIPDKGSVDKLFLLALMAYST
jgi:HEPN domain-containing protein